MVGSRKASSTRVALDPPTFSQSPGKKIPPKAKMFSQKKVKGPPDEIYAPKFQVPLRDIDVIQKNLIKWNAAHLS